MKKIISIILLALFLFNVGGYTLLFWALRKEASREMNARLEQGTVPQEEVLTLQVPLTLPYGLNRDTYERGRASIEHNGEFYHLVRYKLDNDTLSLVYVKDKQEQHLVEVMSDYAKASNDVTQNQAVNLLGKLLHDFQSTAGPIIIHMRGWVAELVFASPHFTPDTGNRQVSVPPPRHAA